MVSEKFERIKNITKEKFEKTRDTVTNAVKDIQKSEEPLENIKGRAKNGFKIARRTVTGLVGKGGKTVAKSIFNRTTKKIKELPGNIGDKIDDLEDPGDLSKTELRYGTIAKLIGTGIRKTVETGGNILEKGNDFLYNVQKNAIFQQILPGYKNIRSIMLKELETSGLRNTTYTKDGFACTIKKTNRGTFIQIGYSSQLKSLDSDALIEFKEKVDKGVEVVGKVFQNFKSKLFGEEEAPKTTEDLETTTKAEDRALKKENLKNNREFINLVGDFNQVLKGLPETITSDNYVNTLTEAKETLIDISATIQNLPVSDKLKTYQTTASSTLEAYANNYESSIEQAKETIEKNADADLTYQVGVAKKSLAQVQGEFYNTINEMVETVSKENPEEIIGENPSIHETINQTIILRTGKDKYTSEEKVDALFDKIKAYVVEGRESKHVKKNGIPISISFGEKEKEQMSYLLQLEATEGFLIVGLTPKSKKDPYLSLQQQFNKIEQPEVV